MDILTAGFVLFFGTSGCMYIPPKPVESKTTLEEDSFLSYSNNTLSFIVDDYQAVCPTLWFATREDLEKYVESKPIKSGYVFMSVGTREIVKVTQSDKPEFKGKVGE